MTDYKWAKTVLTFCKKNGFETGKMRLLNGLPQVEIICSEKIPEDKDPVRQELIDQLPEGSKVLYKVDVKRSTVDMISEALNTTRMPWAIQISDHNINIKTVIPKDHDIWSKIMKLTQNDKYVRKVKVSVLDPNTMRDAVMGGKTPSEAQKLAEEHADVLELACLDKTLQEDIQKQKESGQFISKDNLLDLKITLENCNTVDDLLKSL